LRKSPPGGEKCFLGDLVGLVAAARNAVRDGSHEPLVTLDQLGERLMTSRAGGIDQFEI
jgi:hypothetical protein